MALISLIQDLYAADRDNQVFLHARFGLSEDVLKPYKEALDRRLWPDVPRNQDASVAKAKQAISSYRKTVGEPAGLAELMVYYCKTATGFSGDIGLHDEGFFDALVRMFVQALRASLQLPPRDCDAMIIRLDRVRTFRFISPIDTEQSNIPNPCTSCHTDKANTWAIIELRKWQSLSSWRVSN